LVDSDHPLVASSLQVLWREFNAKFFYGALHPIPIVISPTLPFGRRIGQCSHGFNGRTTTLNVPAKHDRLVADNGTLLHEMVRHFLQERGEDWAPLGGAYMAKADSRARARVVVVKLA
jgi:hypothetical protein